MCHIYASTNPKRYESTTRSVRLQGYVTSVRLENEFWGILEALAGEQHMTVPQFISELHDEAQAEQGEVRNHASMLRVACAVYLRCRAEGQAAVADKAVAKNAPTGPPALSDVPLSQVV